MQSVKQLKVQLTSSLSVSDCTPLLKRLEAFAIALQQWNMEARKVSDSCVFE
jgi:hypothetical protein